MNAHNPPKYLYLDQNIWIYLGQVHYGINNDKNLVRILEKIKRLVDDNKLIVPINVTNVVELYKASDSGKRERLAKFMISISKGYCFIQFVYLTEVEIINLIRKIFGLSELNIQEQAIGQGTHFLIAEGIPPRLTSDKLDDSILQLMNEHLVRTQSTPEAILDLMLNHRSIFFNNKNEKLFDSMVNEIETIRNDEYKIKDKNYRHKVRIAKYIMQIINPVLAELCVEYRFPPSAIIPQGITFKQIMKLFKELPILYTFFCLTSERDRIPNRPIQKNDIYDIASLSFAIPYCDYVVGERFFISIAKKKNLDKLYNTILLTKSNFNDLESYLDKIQS